MDLDAPLSENPNHHIEKKDDMFSQEMHLKIPLLSRGLKLSISEPSRGVQVLHCMCNWYHQRLSETELIQIYVIFSGFLQN
jgi:hypothetical protein